MVRLDHSISRIDNIYVTFLSYVFVIYMYLFELVYIFKLLK